MLSILGWWFGRPSIRLAYFTTAVAMAALLGLRPRVWDYYFLDIAAYGIFGVSVARSLQPGHWAKPLRVLSYGLGVLLIWYQSDFVFESKRDLDRKFAVVSLLEQSLRTRQIDPQDLAGAPFGYQGWHLYPYFVANGWASGAYIAEFEKYLRPATIRLQTDFLNEPAPTVGNGKLQPDEHVLVSDVFPFEWRHKRRFSLIKRNSIHPPEREMDLSKYTFDPFPLNDQEWRQRLAGNSLVRFKRLQLH